MKKYNLVIPGRHHLLSNFLFQELTRVLNKNLNTITDVNGKLLRIDGKIENIIWAVTSANHAHTRRNPVSGNRRESAIEEFSRDLGIADHSFVYHIDDIGSNPNFAKYVLKKIEVESDGQFILTPENTIIGVSTLSVIDMYEKL